LIHEGGGKTIKLHGGPTFSGHPDVFGCIMGHTIVIETKRHGEDGPTERQRENIRRWAARGAVSFWADDAKDAFIRILREIVQKDRDRDADAVQRWNERRQNPIVPDESSKHPTYSCPPDCKEHRHGYPWD
jgi:hypothetical protein